MNKEIKFILCLFLWIFCIVTISGFSVMGALASTEPTKALNFIGVVLAIHIGLCSYCLGKNNYLFKLIK